MTDIRKEVEKIVSGYKGENITLGKDDTFESLGLDSLDVLDLMMKIEEKLGITFDDDIHVATFNELCLKIETMLKTA